MPELSRRLSPTVLIYGGTPAGIVAGVAAARLGARVVLIERSGHLGGILSSGICTAEFNHMLRESFSGLPLEFFARIGAAYGIDAPIFHWEPHVAERVFERLAEEAGIDVVLGEELAQVRVEDRRIRSVVLSSGDVHEAATFIDCSYEGDLMAASGVPFTYGRDSRHSYGEELAGMGFIDNEDQVAVYDDMGKTIDDIVPVSPYLDGMLLEGFVEPAEIIPGSSDLKTANAHYRVTLSSAEDRIPFPRPDGYNPARYLAYQRYFDAFPEAGLRDLIDIYPFPSGRYELEPDGMTKVLPGFKWEMNNRQDRPLSLGHLGGQFNYPDAGHAERSEIVLDHVRHNQGLLYFLANDERLPARVRADMSAFGLPRDEYVDNNHWPYVPYVREARRMIGDFVLTQHDVLVQRSKPDVVGIGSHWIDSHYVQRVAVSDWGFRGEGRVWREVTQPYALPYRIMLPKRSDLVNLLVPVAVSASRVAFCSIRVETQWMALGEAAGTAAAMSAGAAVQDLAVGELQMRLRAQGVNIPEDTSVLPGRSRAERTSKEQVQDGR